MVDGDSLFSTYKYLFNNDIGKSGNSKFKTISNYNTVIDPHRFILTEFEHLSFHQLQEIC